MVLDTLIQYEAPLRLALFLAVFVLLAVAETLIPRRVLLVTKGKRWFANLGIVLINTGMVRLVAPAAAVGIALAAEQRGAGLLHMVGWPPLLEIVLAVLVLDLAIYLQHVMFHAVPLLWRLHRMHHADLDFDVTTGTRFHPVEMLLSLGIKAAVIFLTGAPVAAVLLFEILLNVTAMFNHSNIRMPVAVDAVLRLLVVTPDMHRIHHSLDTEETNRNFGFNLPWWDRLFGTYRDQPRLGHDRMVIGTPAFRDARQCATLGGMLLMPFARRPEGAAMRGEFSEERP
ncbi:MAG: sterol desaturase [Proteobacteria bacterium]|nr:sterol desaturase [Pseudomonadota bacterium]